MPTVIRWKRLLLLGAGITTLTVILWAAYLFTAIWLRVRCARELAEHADSLPEVYVQENRESNEVEIGRDVFLLDTVNRDNRTLDHLESLQQPNIAIVLRHLLKTDRDEPSARTQQVQSLVFSPQGQYIANSGSNTTSVIAWNTETDAVQATSVSLNVTASPGVFNTRQVLALWGADAAFQCYAVTDSNGEKVLVVTRSSPQESGDEQMTEAPLPLELLLIDMAGRVFVRRPCPGSGLVGKLAEPQGKADQLVFGARTYVSDQNGSIVLKVAGPGVVGIVQDGELKTVQTIVPPVPPANETQTAAPPENQ
jgi:hypothetical protein